MIDLAKTWPTGRLVDIQVRVKNDNGGASLIGALNDHKDSFGDFFDNIEIVRVGFKSKMEGGDGCLSHVFDDLLRDFQAYKHGDMHAMERLEQKLLSARNDSVGGL
ncbi:hypothetical protein vBVpP1_60 [Vibrio phage vB_VpP_1]|nr:hypothetical protein vBVpP1_60 [Vibrio phage vB_VpP_1]